jgi:hypothetical protein
MSVIPVVRYMIVCEDWDVDPNRPLMTNIYGILSNIDSIDSSPYPLLYPEICVVLMLTAGHGAGKGQIICTFEDTGQRIWRTRKWPIKFGPDPLDVVGVPFRIRNCQFPYPGRYSVQFWYHDVLVEERPLLLR